jgi:ppGpp synthetase/RelA/SpoT-type nucleotidyltranferase
MEPDDAGLEWLDRQVGGYRRARPGYEQLAAILEQILGTAAATLAPLAIVQSRTKGIVSFAEKALRSRPHNPDPLHQLTDLCGARIIARNRAEVDAVSQYIEDSFDIDWSNSVDTTRRLDPDEFGYRSIHYIVSLRAGMDYGVSVPPSVVGLKAEVQVRTTVEHAWADFDHDLGYKGAFDLPVAVQREIAVIAAQLEDVDRSFTRIQDGLADYAASFGAHLTPEERRTEIRTLHAVLRHDPGNQDLALRTAQLSMTDGDWQGAIDTLAPLVDTRSPAKASPPVLRELGTALCRRFAGSPSGRGYRRGQRYLSLAAAAEPADSAAVAALADSWRGIDDQHAADLYRRAFTMDPTDAYPLGNYLTHELRRTRDPGIVAMMRPAIERCIERRRAQADVAVNLPGAHFDIARFELLLGRPAQSVASYAAGIATSPGAWTVQGALDRLEDLAPVRSGLRGFDWARRVLLLGLTVHWPDRNNRRRLRRLASAGADRVEGPVLIVAGTTRREPERGGTRYDGLVRAAVAGFAGTVISGGTASGVSGLVGEAAGPACTTIGYLPEAAADDADPGYTEVRVTPGRGFSPLEPVQYWTDLVASGVAPADVAVLAVGGGRIASVEYRLALALGARVGVLADSGRAAARLLVDSDWRETRGLVRLPSDLETIRSFVGGVPTTIDPTARESVARTLHSIYLEEVSKSGPRRDPALEAWEELREDFRNSNRDQASRILEKLERIGYTARPATGALTDPFRFTDAEIEIMAEMEHGRWNAERLAAGWTWGPERDPDRKRSPYLVAWEDLPDDIRAYDRDFVTRIPQVLAEAGLEIVAQ